MTREEEMNEAFKLYEKERASLDSFPYYDLWEGFKAGFKYADKHPQYFRDQSDEMMERESLFVDDWYKEHKGKMPTYADAIAWADKHPNGSPIKWQTGEPELHGRYLVQTEKDGFQIEIWSRFIKSWDLYSNSEVIAWCKLSDIEPYKEETK